LTGNAVVERVHQREFSIAYCRGGEVKSL
jgi:hypothetical protein